METLRKGKVYLPISEEVPGEKTLQEGIDLGIVETVNGFDGTRAVINQSFELKKYEQTYMLIKFYSAKGNKMNLCPSFTIR